MGHTQISAGFLTGLPISGAHTDKRWFSYRFAYNWRHTQISAGFLTGFPKWEHTQINAGFLSGFPISGGGAHR